MPKIYYKVVTPSLKSAWVSHTGLTTQYKIGEFVSSPTPETPLAVFETFKAAKNFKQINLLFTAKIFKCNIKDKTKKPWLPGRTGIVYGSQEKNLRKIISLIKAKKKFMHLVCENLPNGTVTCKQVKLLEEIT